jgi:hypothetical protein
MLCLLCRCRCIRLASARVEEVVAQLKQALQQHEVDRVTARVRRHRPAMPGGSAARHVAVLQADDEAADQMERIMQGGCCRAVLAVGGAAGVHASLLVCCWGLTTAAAQSPRLRWSIQSWCTGRAERQQAGGFMLQ